MPNPQNGKIYKLLNNIDDEIYVGSTCESLANRMARHRHFAHLSKASKLYEHMKHVGDENFYIKLIEDYPCEGKEQLLKREGEFIRECGTLSTFNAGVFRRGTDMSNATRDII